MFCIQSSHISLLCWFNSFSVFVAFSSRCFAFQVNGGGGAAHLSILLPTEMARRGLIICFVVGKRRRVVEPSVNDINISISLFNIVAAYLPAQNTTHHTGSGWPFCLLPATSTLFVDYETHRMVDDNMLEHWYTRRGMVWQRQRDLGLCISAFWQRWQLGNCGDRTRAGVTFLPVCHVDVHVGDGCHRHHARTRFLLQPLLKIRCPLR